MNDRRFALLTKGWATAPREQLGKQIGEVVHMASGLKPSQSELLRRMRDRHQQMVQSVAQK